MKKIIHVLFAVAALAAALQPVAAYAEGTKWVFVIVAFVSGQPVESKIYGADSKVMCVKAQQEAKTQLVDSSDVQFSTSECVAVKVPAVPKPKADANT